MVTRVYNQYMPNIIRPKQEAEHKLAADAGEQGFNPHQESEGLATVTEEAEHHKIHLNTILHDFKSTMDALGADNTVRGEVDAYLSVVSLQAEKSAPSIPFIRQTLKTAADSLDGFITQELDRPSRVVRDWVEALLLQKIEYRDTATPILTELDRPWKEKTEQSNPENESQKSHAQNPSKILNKPLTADEKAFLKDQVLQGKNYIKTGQTKEALSVFESARESLKGKNRPDLDGKILNLIGRGLEKAGKTKEAVAYFEQAESQLSKAGQWEKQIPLRYKLGRYYDERGDLKSAQSYYQGVLSLQEEHGLHEKTDDILNDLGVIYLRQGDSSQALSTLNKAAQVASSQSSVDAGQLLPDIYSNIGALHRLNRNYQASAQAYQQSLKLAQSFKNKTSYIHSMGSLIELYQESGQSQKAKSLQVRLEKIS